DYQDAGPCERGQWTDWVFHVRWSQDAGLIEVWKNGQPVGEPITGRTTFHEDTQHYIKIGIYKWVWNGAEPDQPPQRRLIYHDELRIVDGDGVDQHLCRDTVSPRGECPPRKTVPA